MAQYDGSIRINTQIKTKEAQVQLSTLENKIVKTSDKIASLRSKMDALKDQKIPTQEFTDLQKKISSAEKELEKMISQDSKLSDVEIKIKKLSQASAEYVAKMKEVANHKIPTQEYIELEREIDSLSKKLGALSEKKERFIATGGSKDSTVYKRMTYDIDDLKASLNNTIFEMRELKASGKDFAIDTEQYKNLYEKYRSVNQELEKQKGIHSEIAQKQADSARKTIELKGQMQQLVAEGKDFTLGQNTEEFAKLGQQLQYAENDLSVLAQRHDILIAKQKMVSSGYSKLGQVVRKGFSVVQSAINKAGAGIKKFGGFVKSVFSRFHKSVGKSNGLLSTLSSRFRGIALSLLIFNWISKGFNAMISGMKEGFKNLYNEVESFKSSVDGLKASSLTLKNSFAAAFRPLVEVAIPYIQKTIDAIIDLMNVVAQFTAAITGQKTYTKAIRQTTEAIKEQNKAQNRQLSSLDKLNNLTSESGGAGGASGTGETMFEELPLTSQFTNISEWFKEMWDKADFTELGEVLGSKIKNGLDSINWSGIKESARNIASSIATLINGFVQTDGLGYSIGNTLAQGINTGFEFLNSFVHKFDWKSAGSFVADQLNGFFDGIDWNLIYDTFVTGFGGLAESINEFINTFEWDNLSTAVSWTVRTISDSLTDFFTTTEFKALGQEIGTQIENLLQDDEMWYSVGSAIGSGLQAAFDFLFGLIDPDGDGKIDFSGIINAIKNALKGLFEHFDDAGTLAVIIVGGIAAKMILKSTVRMFSGAATAMGDSIAGSLTQYALPAILAAVGGWNLGNLIGRKIFGDEAYDNFTWSDFFGALNWEDYRGAYHEMMEDLRKFFGLPTDETRTEYESLGEAIDDMTERARNDAFGAAAATTEATASITENLGLLNDSTNQTAEQAEESSQRVGDTWWTAAQETESTLQNFSDQTNLYFTKSYNAILENTKSFLERLKKQLKNMPTLNAGSVLGGIAATMPRSVSFNTTSPVMAALSTQDIPAYATGQVIPTSMKRHLAILGDNTRETEVVSPLSTMKQAFMEALVETGVVGGNNNSTGGNTYEFSVDGQVFFRVMEKYAQEYKKQHGGKIAFS